MHFSSLFSAVVTSALALSASAQQQGGSYTDSKTGITFQCFSSSAGATFGIALPQTPSGDFIGQIAGKGTGWVGVSLGGTMLNKLLIAVWPSNQQVLASFRKASSYGSPATTTGTFSMTTIARGTAVNSTHFTYTFLCRRCITNDTLTFNAGATSNSFGWAYNAKEPTNKGTAAGASFSKHSAQGQVAVSLTAARSANYPTWAGLVNSTMRVGY